MSRFLVPILACALLAAAATPSIRIDVHDASITDVLALLGAQAHVNIVADASVKPDRITLRLDGVTFENALTVLVRSRGLQVRREGSVLLVGDAGSMNRRYGGANDGLGAQTTILPLTSARPEEIAKELQDALPPGTVVVSDKRTNALVVSGDADTIERARHLTTALDASGADARSGPQAYRLKYVRVEEAMKQLKLIAPEAVLVGDDQHNTVMAAAPAAAQAEIASLLRSLDRPSPQVLFEVRVADVTPQNSDSNFGLEWGGADFQGKPSLGSTTYAFTGGTLPVNVRLNALISEGRAQILATPKLVTLNNKEADLLIGQTFPIVFNTSVLGGQNVQFVDIGVKLRLTPTIGTDGVVTAELHPEYSELLGVTDSGYPIIANRKIDSTLRAKDSETIVLGGLMRDVDNQTLTRVPGLSQIPVLGKFFENKRAHHERDEIVFLITPHVIKPSDEP